MLDPVLQSIFNQDDRLAVIDRDQSFSFFSLQRSSRMLAKRLKHLKLRHGERIAVLLPNSMHAVVAFLAVAHTGYSYLPLSIDLKFAELQSIFRKCGVRAVICCASTSALVPETVQVVELDKVLDDAKGDLPECLQKPDPEREFVCLSTSGSSGDPRIVARTAAAIYANLRQVTAGLQVTAEDRFLSVVPFWHANGFSNCLLLPLFCGASIVTMDRFLPHPMLDLILDKKPTMVIGSPFVFRALAQVVEPHYRLDHVRTWISSGAALPVELDKKLRSLNIRVRQLYGSSETGTISISFGDQLQAGSVGKPLQGVRVRLVDGNNKEVAQGHAGKIQVSSPALFSGYVGELGNEIPMTEDGFYCMEDLGTQDIEGNLALTGRNDAMINVSGVKVDPVEIQQVLMSMPGIAQALAFGTKDANGLEMIKVLLVAESKISTEDVLHYCRNRLAEYKLPRSIEMVKDIPQELMGKSPRKLLENEYGIS